MYSKVNTEMHNFKIIRYLTLKWAYKGLLSSLFLKYSECGLSPLEGKLSFPTWILLCDLYSIIVNNEKYEFNKQDMLSSPHSFYQIHLRDKSFVSSVDGPDR